MDQLLFFEDQYLMIHTQTIPGQKILMDQAEKFFIV